MLTHIVDALARSNPPSGLIFKGGTALRLCFYEEFRYSADLDFSLRETTSEEARQAIEQSLARCKEDIGLSHLELDPHDEERIEYEGPLGARRRLKLNIADDELVIEVCERILIRRYEDQTDPPPSLLVYITEFFQKLSPLMDTPVRADSPWVTEVPNEIFSDGASAPKARRQDLRTLNDTIVGWALTQPAWLAGQPA